MVCLAIGLAASLLSYHQLASRSLEASDFSYPLRAARRLIAGLDAYNDPTAGPGHAYPHEAQFPYPLPAALIALPFVALPPYAAGAAFIGLSSSLLAYGCTRQGWKCLGIFLSPSYFVALSVAQWSPLAVAAGLLPALLPLAIAKPNSAFPPALGRPRLQAWLWCGLPLLLAELASPGWIPRWLDSFSTQPAGRYLPPATVPLVGPLALVASLGMAIMAYQTPNRRRRTSLRVLLATLVVPQHPFFYDQLTLWLVPETLGQSLILSASAWAAYLAWFGQHGGVPSLALTAQGPDLAWTMVTFHLPALTLAAWQLRRELGRCAAWVWDRSKVTLLPWQGKSK
jgi:hypothetical protein